ncbi:hypothetical protein EVAR_39435_1 [Eumeta japonica]|uniref:Uncharacterized protein n=1 Tax=Eumeta variegata TaxID=151549 RepID=A0A4C1W2T2_EUMVA|nr:hypothetical protein EVAR_39435_1 [Eumeta japonica]
MTPDTSFTRVAIAAQAQWRQVRGADGIECSNRNHIVTIGREWRCRPKGVRQSSNKYGRNRRPQAKFHHIILMPSEVTGRLAGRRRDVALLVLTISPRTAQNTQRCHGDGRPRNAAAVGVR